MQVPQSKAQKGRGWEETFEVLHGVSPLRGCMKTYPVQVEMTGGKSLDG